MYCEAVSGGPPVGTAPRSFSRAPVGYLLAAIVVSLLAAAGAVVTVRHAGRAVYAMPPTAVAVALAASVLAVAGAAGMVAVRRHDVALLSALVASTVAFGVLAIFSFGVLLLLAGVGIAMVLARRSSDAGPWAMTSGVAMAIGLVTAALLAIQRPVAECPGNGVHMRSSIWSPGPSSGSVQGGPGGDSTGTVTQGRATYTFACRDGHLVEFRKISRS